MDAMLVRGGKVLKGDVRASGSKNSALPILLSSLLAEGQHIFTNVPRLMDIKSTVQLLELLGCKVEFEQNSVRVGVFANANTVADYDVVRKMRASILCLGPLLTRFGFAKVSLPGGCAIGTRPIDLHLEGLRLLGAEIEISSGYVLAKAERLKGTDILFETTTVGGTENLMMAAALAEGVTRLENAAKEPEIVDLANYLNKMGARIRGAGTSIITIEGVDRLQASEHEIIPDRIEVGTLLIAGAITGGQVKVVDCRPNDLAALIEKLREAGVKLEVSGSSIEVLSNGEIQGVDITTAPHPGFPTDLQAQFMALMCEARGTSVITENIFENRFMHVQELSRMGANITPKTRVAVVRGQKGGLEGAPVMATDLRASACLVLAGLVARGETKIHRIYHLDRGYEALEKKLSALGADIERVSG